MSIDEGSTAVADAGGSGGFRPSSAQVAVGTVLAILLFAYPFFFEEVVRRFGVRAGALALLTYGLAFALGRRLMGIPVHWRSLSHLLLLVLAGVTAASGDARYLLLVPAFIYLALCRYFWSTLSQPITIIEHVARFIVPVAPDFIRPYCRKSTMAWSAFFFANACIIAWLVWSGRVAAWRAYTGWQMFALIGAICAVDFVIRKWWFRYYFHDHLFDRIWSRIFPAQNTAMGRRSMEYIRRMREEIGLPPP